MLSTDESATYADVTVTCNYSGPDGDVTCSRTFEVRRPDHLVRESIQHRGYGTPPYGWYSDVGYVLYNQLDEPVPNMPVNEKFGTHTPVYPGETWPVPVKEYSWVTKANGNFTDSLVKAPLGIPLPLWPGPRRDPPVDLSEELIDKIEQTFRAGSETPGVGCVVQEGVVYRYLDHGDVFSQ